MAGDRREAPSRRDDSFQVQKPVSRGRLAVACRAPTAGPEWVHEIKHAAYRLMARVSRLALTADPERRLGPPVSADRQAVNQLKLRSCLIDGETKGVLRSNGFGASARTAISFCAFDLLELDGPAGGVVRSAQGDAGELATCVRALISDPGDIVFTHACRTGVEGIVSNVGVALRGRALSGLVEV
jgi:bifunctional non-homologous end joining protein LigD